MPLTCVWPINIQEICMFDQCLLSWQVQGSSVANNLAMTGCLSGQIAGKEVSKAIWVTKVEMTPGLPFHKAPSFSGFEIDLLTASSISPNVHGLSLLLILEQIHVSKFSGFLCILIPG